MHASYILGFTKKTLKNIFVLISKDFLHTEIKDLKN